MKRVLTAVVLIPLVLLVVFKAPLWIFAAVCSLVALVAADEYLDLAKKYSAGIPKRFTMLLIVFAALLLQGAMQERYDVLSAVSQNGIPVLLLLAPFGLMLAQLKTADLRDSALGASLATFVIPYVVVPFSCLVAIQAMYGWFFIVWLFLLVWSGDIFAYYVGKNFGKRLIAPRVSPKKTWEGTVASVLGSILVSWLFCSNIEVLDFRLQRLSLLAGNESPLHSPPVWVPIAVAVMVNVVAQFGDLFESAIKRGADVKDSGNILPGHGGMLDRVDALLFAAPVAMLLFLVVYPFFRLGRHITISP